MTSEIDDILNDIENIKTRITKIKSEQTISEEKIEIAKEGKFESTVLSAKNDSTIEIRTIEICDYCHKKLETKNQNFGVCSKCSKKLCEKCFIEFRSQVICPDDLRRVYPLSREQFQVMLLVVNSIDKPKDISKITCISKNNVKNILSFMQASDYLARSGFWGSCMTSAGMEAFYAYSQFYGNENEMVRVTQELAKFVGRQ